MLVQHGNGDLYFDVKESCSPCLNVKDCNSFIVIACFSSSYQQHRETSHNTNVRNSAIPVVQAGGHAMRGSEEHVHLFCSLSRARPFRVPCSHATPSARTWLKSSVPLPACVGLTTALPVRRRNGRGGGWAYDWLEAPGLLCVNCGFTDICLCDVSLCVYDDEKQATQ